MFEYLRALDEATNKAKRNIEDQPWRFRLNDLPDHESIQLVAPVSAEAKEGEDDEADQRGFKLHVRRPKLSDCPSPPANLTDWLEREWQNLPGEINVKASRSEMDEQQQTVVVSFDDDPARVEALARWRADRNVWIETERPAREAMRVFERLYEVRGRIEREGEKIELVLGDGILSWKRSDGCVYHPVLLQRVQLEFDASVPEFTIAEADSPTEFYSALFNGMTDVGGSLLGQIKQELAGGQFHPLGAGDTAGFLRSFVTRLSAQGEFLADVRPPLETGNPTIGRGAVVFLRARTIGLAAAIEATLDYIKSGGAIPSSLLRIVGIDHQPTASMSEKPLTWLDECHPPDVLFSKPANAAQIRIAHRLEKTGSVLVQGPPGTGKSHTIANLIGHLLAQGKSVLVTSHATKALRVLREQVVEELRPLCVSLLDSDVESRDQLESSVRAISVKLSQGDPNQLEKQAQDLEYERHSRIMQFRLLGEEIVKQRAREYEPIVVADNEYPASKAARLVKDGEGKLDWLPGPVKAGASLSLSVAHLAELYRTNSLVPAEDEQELNRILPDASKLPSVARFESLVQRRAALANIDRSYRADLWSRAPEHSDMERLDSSYERLQNLGAAIHQAQRLDLITMIAGMRGTGYTQSWEDFLALAVEVCTCADQHQSTIFQHKPVLPSDTPIGMALHTATEIVEHLEGNKRLGWLVRVTHPDWDKFASQSKVATGKPSETEHFRALLSAAKVAEARLRLSVRWTSQLVPLGMPEAAALTTDLETACGQITARIRRNISWHSDHWLPIIDELRGLALDLDRLLDEQPPDFSECGDLHRINRLILGPLQQVLAARRARMEWDAVESEHAYIVSFLEECRGREQESSAVAHHLRLAVRDWNVAEYAKSYCRLAVLWTEREQFERRQELLARLEHIAPGWAEAIRTRDGIHGADRPPANIQDAWLWRQLEQELSACAAKQELDLECESAQVANTIRRITAVLIEAKTWAAQIRRTNNNFEQRQALGAWLNTMKKIGVGKGVHAPRLKTEASKLLKKCQSAVPIWIMPLSRVAENFTPGSSHFDVVIIDEASQADATGLLALQLADKAIVVGDDQQVSPLGVGEETSHLQHLIEEHLQGVPHKHLYDRRTSIYDLAGMSFGTAIRLVEHFRCVPDIIQFSNFLSYNGEIRPLRDPSTVKTLPHVVAHRTYAMHCQGEANEREAEEVSALILAASEQPEYANKTFGVVSMVSKEKQACRIEQILRQRISEKRFLAHRILCGNAAQFQGDERDVMFLSMVDTSDGAVLALKQAEMYKQRFNVAASRARDQKWVVYSLDAQSYLKPGDLRRRLIEYAENPASIANQVKAAEAKVESEFERLVATRLIQAGYLVTPQWSVGYYRIDMVIQGSGKRIAVECDGDRFHPHEKLAEDMARQAVLERLGWTFIRIRGSQFFRDPDGTMKTVTDKITAFGIDPFASNAEPSSVPDSELLQRVKTRAAQVRAEWEHDGIPEWKHSQPEAQAAVDTALAQESQSAKEIADMETAPARPDDASLTPAQKAWQTIHAMRTPEQITAIYSAAGFKAAETRKQNLEALVASGLSENGLAGSEPNPPPGENGQLFDANNPDDEEELDKSEIPGGAAVITKKLTSDEIRAAIHASLPTSGPIGREQLIRATAERLGIQRIRKPFRSRLNRTIGAEARWGRIAVSADADQLWTHRQN